MIVLDASAVVGVLATQADVPLLVDRITRAESLHAPHLIDVEFLHALRRLVRIGVITPSWADGARRDFADLVIERYPHSGLAQRGWELRESLSAYDAAYVALSESLAAPLVTRDARLSRAHGHRARIELFA